MRKKIGFNVKAAVKDEDGGWLDLDQEAEVEVTSEDPEHPIEFAFSPGHPGGWRAGFAGKQSVRLVFDLPRKLRLIHLVFREARQSRTQEFALRWSTGTGEPFEEILRQQYNFSPGSSEIEDYVVNLDEVKVFELEIEPSVDGRQIHASLAELRLR